MIKGFIICSLACAVRSGTPCSHQRSMVRGIRQRTHGCLQLDQVPASSVYWQDQSGDQVQRSSVLGTRRSNFA